MSFCHNSSFDCSFYYYRYFDLLAEYKECQKRTVEEEKFSEPMLWIGVYVAAVSLVGSLAIAADALRGFYHRKLWFPSKFFTLNAASLTLLAVAMKLPLDLNSPMPGPVDQLVKLSSAAFLCIVMGNFMPSLGNMDEEEIGTNLTALGILVITMIVNVCIQLYTGVISGFMLEHVVVMLFMLVLLVLSSFSALTVPISARMLELKFSEMRKRTVPSHESEEESGKDTVEKLKDDVKKYWVTAQTGCLQFVMARSATSSVSGAICFLTAFTLVEAEIRMHSSDSFSDYKWSTFAILVIHTFGVVVGTIAPAFRWFMTISFKCSKERRKRYRDEFGVEKFWIQRLVEWKENPLALRIQDRKCRKFVHDMKHAVLNLFIAVQIVIVVGSKTVGFVSIFFISQILTCLYYCKLVMKRLAFEPNAFHTRPEPEKNMETDLSHYVFQLEGEEELPQKILQTACQSVDRLIYKAKMQHPKHLVELLEKSTNLNEVSNSELGEQVSPKCWSLAVVTLTSIAVAIPNIENDMVDRLLFSVSQGLVYIKLIEKGLDPNGNLMNARNASDVVWLGVELYRRWLDNDLHKMALEGLTYEQNISKLANVAQKCVMEFKRSTNGGLEQSVANWPIKVIAADSMRRISQSILVNNKRSIEQTSSKLFEQLSVMIADIVGSCLTNLPRAITMKLFSGPIQKREESVRLAACLLGETEEILKILQREKIPGLDSAAVEIF